MLNRSPSVFHNVVGDDEERLVNSKKIYSRRPWYALPIDPAEILDDQEKEYNQGEVLWNIYIYRYMHICTYAYALLTEFKFNFVVHLLSMCIVCI